MAVKAEDAVGHRHEGNHKSGTVDISVALAANDMDSVPKLLEAIAAAGQRLSADDSATRLELLERARDLVRALETPRETMIKHCWAQTTAFTALSVGVERGVFKLLAQDGGSPKTAKQMAAQLDLDPPLVRKCSNAPLILS
jgi:hypothetical protein